MTLDWEGAIVVSTSEFEVAWDLLGLGETPWQLDPPRSGLTTADRAAVVATAVGGLHARGLGARPALTEHLRVLAHHEWSVDVRFVTNALVTGVAAVRGQAGTLAVRHGTEIALLGVAADGAIDAITTLSGVRSPGSGRDVVVPAAVLDAARVHPLDDPRFVTSLTDRGVSPQEGAALAAMCRDVRIRGQLGATVSAGDGTRLRRVAPVIGFHTTPAGQFRHVRTGGIVRIGPASTAALRSDLEALVSAIRR